MKFGKSIEINVAIHDKLTISYVYSLILLKNYMLAHTFKKNLQKC